MIPLGVKQCLLLLLLLVSAGSTVLAQADTLFIGINPRQIALSHLQIHPLAGKQIRGILYALTDSTVLYFRHNRTAIRAFKHGQLPDLDTISATEVKKLVVQRRSYPWRPVVAGTLISSWLAVRMIAQTGRGPDLLVVVPVAVFLVFPAGPIVGGIISMFLHRSARINGDPAELARKRRYLDRHTIETQRQQLRLRTGLAG